MFRALLRVVLLIVVLVAVGAFLLGWWGGRRDIDEPRDVVGTAGVEERARATGDRAKAAGSELAQDTKEAGRDVAQKTAVAADQARRTLAEGSLTAKIKAKMALDDTVKALNLDVDTTGTVVTISGAVANETERTRALQLARETEGVTKVVDRIQVRR